MSYTGPTQGTSTGTGTGTGSESGTGITTAMQAAIQTAIAALPQGQYQGKNYKLSDQANFSGHAENIELFLLECTMRFRVLPLDFDITNKKGFLCSFADERRSCSNMERAISS